MKSASVFLVVALLMGILLKCTKSPSDPTPAATGTTTLPVPDFFTVNYDITSLPISDTFEPSKIVGTIEDLSLNEISGIASSYVVPGALWVEEDSGNENKIYLLSNSGKTLATFRMTSLDDRDWEDLSVSTGPLLNVRYIYLAETGDNKNNYPTKYIFRFAEPPIANMSFPITQEIPTVEKISFQYPDGIKNAEAIMIDPVTKDIYVVSKEGQAVIYVARYPQETSKVFTLTKVGALPISDVTAADISQDGKEILIKNYAVVLYWKKSEAENITQLLQKTPLRVPYLPEQKGESICWAVDGSGYFTTSEGPNQPIYYYKRK